MRMDEQDIRLLHRLGSGNVSAGFRAVLQIAQATMHQIVKAPDGTKQE